MMNVEELELRGATGDLVSLMWLAGIGQNAKLRKCLEVCDFGNSLPLVECLTYFGLVDDAKTVVSKSKLDEAVKQRCQSLIEFIKQYKGFVPERHWYDDQSEYEVDLKKVKDQLENDENWKIINSRSFSQEFIDFMVDYNKNYQDVINDLWN